MKRLHIFLVALNIVSTFFILQIIFNWFPAFSCNYSPDKIEQINSLVIDLSIGVITSTLFYILLVYLPDKKKSRIARELNSTSLRYLAENMQFIIIHLIKSYDIKVKQGDYNYSRIDFEEFYKIKSNIFSKDYISGTYEIFFRDANNPKSTGITEINLIIKTMKLRELIEKTLSIPSIVFEDGSLIKLLNMIHDCRFFKAIIACSMETSIKLEAPYYQSIVIQEFYLLYTLLLKYTSSHNFYFERRKKVSQKTDIQSNLTGKINSIYNPSKVEKNSKGKRKNRR